ncbi:DUF6531 domain-containing protein [Spartinivicinus ruber]|uniref:DUF6531 domain-containing protein n=1 Tax=Spartinivicinus ruber TaxID=2683272 RepID=UPI0013D2D6F2|nr:DUF6531 domain-containing protein [Spartinivicinus ruber]
MSINVKLSFLLGAGLASVLCCSTQAEVRWYAPYTSHDPWKTDSISGVYVATPYESCIEQMNSYQRSADAFRKDGRGYSFLAVENTYWAGKVNPNFKKCSYLFTYPNGYSYQWHLNAGLQGKGCESPLVFDEKVSGCINKNAQPQSCETLKGNPVNIATGNKIQWFTDLSLSNLSIKRLYLQAGKTGSWRFSFSRKLSVYLSADNLIAHITRDNGQEVVMYQEDGVWQDDDANGYQVKALENGQYQLVTAANLTETYDNQGRLIKVESPSQQAIELAYEDKKLVISQGNSSINYHLNDNQQITRIESGSLVRNYQYDEQGQLTSADFNGNYKETYHYENDQYPTLLTGITNANNQRYATWQYDEKGRATVSKHAGDVDNVTFSYPDENSTTVTNPLGKKTTYRFEEINGFRKVKSVEGHASANCLAANKDYEYFDNGLLKSKTDWQGVKTTYQYNDRGLATEKTEAAGTPQARTVSTEWHETFSLPVKVTEPGKTTIYEYSDKGQLTSQRQESAK